MAATQMFGRIKGCFCLWLIARPPPYLGKDKWNLKTVNLKNCTIYCSKNTWSVWSFRRKFIPKIRNKIVQDTQWTTRPPSIAKKTLLTTRPNMRTSINKINKNFKQELKLKTWKRCLRKRSMLHRNRTLKKWFLKDKEACFQFFMNEKL